jgi:hypothetical protein
MNEDGAAYVAGRIVGSLVVAAILVWLFVYARSRDAQAANRAVLSWRTIVLTVILVVLAAATRLGEAEAAAAGISWAP